MIYVNDIIPMKLYRKPFILPLNMKNKKYGSAVMLMTPNYRSTVKTLSNPLIMSKYYESYYIEKDISAYINGNIAESVVNEGYLNTSFSSINKIEVIYNGDRYYTQEVSKIITPNFIYSLINEFKVNIQQKEFVVNVIPAALYKERSLRNKAYEINVIDPSFFRGVKTDDYNDYLVGSVVESLAIIMNPNMYIGFMEGFITYVSGYAPDLGLDCGEQVAKIFAHIEKKHGLRTLLNIIKTNNISKYQSYAIELGFDKAMTYIDRKIYSEDTKVKPENLTVDHIVRKIKMGSRKGIYKINQIKKIQDVNDPHSADGTIKDTNTDNEKKDTKPEVEKEKLSEDAVFDFGLSTDEVQITEDFIRNGDNIMLFETGKDDKQLQKLIYKERLKSNRDVFAIHDQVKADIPYIKYTYTQYKLYRKRNIFIDFSYYNNAFFKNNMYKLDRGVNLYFEFLNRLINDKRIATAGYDKKFVIIPVNDWDIDPNTKMWMYNEDINPVSVFMRLIRKDLPLLQETFKDVDFLFISEREYFKVNFSNFDSIQDTTKFINFIKKMRNIDGVTVLNPDDEDHSISDKVSATVMTINTIEKLEKSTGVKIDDISAIDKVVSKSRPDTMSRATANIVDVDRSGYIEVRRDKDKSEDDGEIIDTRKDDLVTDIANAALDSDNEEELIDKLDNRDASTIIATLSADEGNTKTISDARATRIVELNSSFKETSYNNKKISDIINSDQEKPQKVTNLDIDTVNEDMKHLGFVNRDADYDINEDIIRMLYFFGERHDYPIAVRELDIKDASTSEDYIDNYNVQMEDGLGKRFTLNFDVPKFKNKDKYMLLRGNKKTISNQGFMMPLSKSDLYEAQIVSNYSKIFVEKFGSSVGKSYMNTDKLIKVLKKHEYKNIKIVYSDNSRVCNKYDLPIDYIDMASIYDSITITSSDWKIVYYFNQDYIYDTFKVDPKKGIPIGVQKYYESGKEEIIYSSSYPPTDMIIDAICNAGTVNFMEDFMHTTASTRYAYSRCSIMSSKIPLIIVAGLCVGMTEVLKRANVEYDIVEKKPKFNSLSELCNYDFIKFKDGYLVYRMNYASSLLMNGLRAVPIDEYSVFDMDKRSTYIDMLDLFGGRIKADGLLNFYELMIDPITAEVATHYGLPNDYIGLLVEANKLLADNKFIKFTSTEAKRFRRKELVAGYAYLCLAREYGNYVTQIRHGRHMPMTIKKSAIIDAIMADPTMGDLSVLNPLLEIEAYNAESPKGLSGMNTDRGYTMDKRGYDESMHNVMALSTGFAGNVGINRQMTIDANITSARGYVTGRKDDDEFSTAKSLAMTEALTPYGTTRDDPFRSAMNFVQRSKHGVRVVQSSPSLITNGADEAMPYLISDLFAFKAKGDGEVVELTDTYMIIKYAGGDSEYVDLTERVEKNSNGGFFVTIKNSTDLKVGDKVKTNQIVAYDKTSFSDEIGYYNNIAYNVGTFTKMAIMSTDEGYEDSTIISDHLSHAMASEQVVKEDKSIPPQSNVYNLVKIGQQIQEGEPLMIIQSEYDDEDVNKLLKNLIDDEDEISDLGRIVITSPITGVIQDIVISRTVEIDELSPTLQKIVKDYECPIHEVNKKLKEYGINDNTLLKADYTLPTVGKLKNVRGVLIEIYIKYFDLMGVGDKLINFAANKGVVKDKFPVGEEPYSEHHPDERINVLLAVATVLGRMTGSILINGAINKVLVELDRMNKEDLGIDYDINL